MRVPPSVRRHVRASVAFLTTTAVAVGLALVLPTPSAQAAQSAQSVHAAPLPADFSASAHGDIVALRADLLGGSLAGVTVGHAQAITDSTATPRSQAASANLDVALGGSATPLDEEAVSAPPSADPPAVTLLDVPLAPLADAKVVTGDVAAAWAGDQSCPAAVDGRRLLGSARTTLAGLTLADLPGVGAVATVEASTSQSRTAMVDRPSGGSRVVSTSTTDVGDVSLLGGAAVVRVESPVTLTASSDGARTTVDYTDPIITVTLAGGRVIDVPSTGVVVPVPLDLGLLAVDLEVRAFRPTDTSSDRTASGTLDAVVGIDLDVTSAAGPLVDLHLGVGEMATRATSPRGGVECVAGSSDSDGDGLSDAQEGSLGTDPDDPDTDNDGLSDGAEVNTHQTDPLDPDTDDGGVSDGAEVAGGTDPLNGADDVASTGDGDGDGLSDVEEGTLGTDPADPDSDNDGLSDGAEVNTHQTDPLDPDTDAGGVSDGAEVDNGTDPLDGADDVPGTVPPGGPSAGDTDGDGLGNAQEAELGTDPKDPDTDNDGLTDGAEVRGPLAAYPKCRTNPRRRDTDGDRLADGVEERGIKVTQKVVTKSRTKRIGLVRPSPCAKDTDRDGLRDDREVRGAKVGQRVRSGRDQSYVIGLRRTNPVKADTDRDGLRDKAEVTGSANRRFARRKTDPAHYDTDRGGNPDGREVAAGSDPTSYASYPANPRLAASDGVP